MTKEEKKAIEDLKKLCIEVLKNDDLYNYDNYSPFEKMTMTNIVLNLLKKQQKEIDRLQNYVKENEIYKKNLFNYAEKKDKIIDLMAKNISSSDSSFSFCQYINETIRCKEYAGENKLLCNECIRQYFEKKASEEDAI